MSRSERQLWLMLALLTLRLTDGPIVGDVWLEAAAWVVIVTTVLDYFAMRWIKRHPTRARAFVARQRAKKAAAREAYWRNQP